MCNYVFLFIATKSFDHARSFLPHFLFSSTVDNGTVASDKLSTEYVTILEEHIEEFQEESSTEFLK